jgi:hypothetical protein
MRENLKSGSKRGEVVKNDLPLYSPFAGSQLWGNKGGNKIPDHIACFSFFSNS